MAEDKTPIDWQDIARRLDLPNAERFVHREIRPLIEDVPIEDGAAKQSSSQMMNRRLQKPLFVATAGFGLSFTVLLILTNDSPFGILLLFFLAIPMFFLSFIVSAYAYRRTITAALIDGQLRFVARSKALKKLAEQIGLTYVPSPGGAPEALKRLATYRYTPQPIKDIAAMLEDHGGMDEPLAAARKSGVMIGLGAILGSTEQKEKHYAAAVASVKVEDGFQGTRGGITFSAFEWVQSVEDEPDVHHLVLVYRAPQRLYGITQLRSRHITWPVGHPDATFTPIGVVAPAFEDRFRMRTTDQVEARTVFDPLVIARVAELAHGETVRAVAIGEHLVFDIEGADRFAMVDVLDGRWSEQTIADTMINIAEMLELSEAIAHAFNLRARA